MNLFSTVRTLSVVDVETNVVGVALIALKRDLHSLRFGEREEVGVVTVELLRVFVTTRVLAVPLPLNDT